MSFKQVEGEKRPGYDSRLEVRWLPPVENVDRATL